MDKEKKAAGPRDVHERTRREIKKVKAADAAVAAKAAAEAEDK